MVNVNSCPLCMGRLIDGHVTFSTDYGQGVIVVRHVPAQVCDQCGENWIDDHISAQLQVMVQDAKAKRRQIEVIDMAA